MFITLLVLSSLAGGFLASLSGVALAKQRQAATGLATAVMEQLRAIDYGTLSSGLTCSDLTSDPRVTLSGACASGVTGTFTPGVGGISEPLVIQVSGPTAAPLNPHITTRTLENATYTVSSYVSKSSATATAFNLTVLVKWASSVSRGSKTVIQRSVAYSPTRCLSSATHPYAGACQAAFNGDAGLAKAGIVVLNADDGSSLIPGLNGTKLDLTLNSLSTTLSAEQVTALSALVSTTGVDAFAPGKTSTGGLSASVSADTDPSSASAGVGTGTLAQGSTSTLSLSGTGGVLSLYPTTSDTGTLDARASSSATSCMDASGTAVTATNQPCSWANVQPAGTSASLGISLPNGAPNWNIATVGAAPAPARATVARIGTSGGTACPTASGPGCLTAQASRSLGTVLLGGLPTANGGDSPPTGWGGALITVSGLQESAYAEAGTGHRNPTFTRSAGTLSYYDVASGTVKTLSSFRTLTSDFAADLGTVTGTYNAGGQTAVVSVSGTMRVGAATPLSPSTTAPDPTCKASACLYNATPASTLIATLVYNISLNGVQDTKFAVTVDLGAVLARASYKASFDA
ncbi:MAG: hypothetical protein JWM02_2622 [Frankiales bacterium]|nr:hypothetical protein [Frankiales bacterium]